MNQFPSFPTPSLPISTTPEWKTLVSDFDSGKEQRRQIWTFPKRSIPLKFNALVEDYIDILYAFHVQQKGRLEPFWFFWPKKREDNTWQGHTNEYVGRGDGGATVIFELPGKEVSSPITGSDLAVNGDFETDPTANWSVTNGTIAGVAGGVSGNRLELTRVSGGGQWAYQTPTFEVGKQYRLGCYVKSGTSGNEAFSIGIADNAFSSWVSRVQGISSAVWTYYETIFTATETNSHINLQKDTATAGTMLFDKVRLYETTGVNLKVYVNGVLAGATFLSGGGDAGVDRVQFDIAPANGAMITADFRGQIRYRMRFTADSMSRELFEQYIFTTGLELLEVRI